MYKCLITASARLCETRALAVHFLARHAISAACELGAARLAKIDDVVTPLKRLRRLARCRSHAKFGDRCFG